MRTWHTCGSHNMQARSSAGTEWSDLPYAKLEQNARKKPEQKVVGFGYVYFGSHSNRLAGASSLRKREPVTRGQLAMRQVIGYAT